MMMKSLSTQEDCRRWAADNKCSVHVSWDDSDNNGGGDGCNSVNSDGADDSGDGNDDGDDDTGDNDHDGVMMTVMMVIRDEDDVLVMVMMIVTMKQTLN